MSTRAPRTVTERILAYTPKSDNTWFCPWFVVLSIGCMVAILSGILAVCIAGSALGFLYALGGSMILAWQVGHRQGRPPSC